MAHFAELDENNVVIRVLRVLDDNLLDEDGVEQEHIGISFLHQLLGDNLRWVQTSYTGKFRGCFASTGWLYLPDRDAFIHPSPYSSWVLSNTQLQWEAPLPYPSDGNDYDWDETTQQWILL